MYQLKRSEKITETFSLPDGGELLEIVIDIDNIAGEFLARQDALTAAQKKLKESQRAGKRPDFSAAYQSYGAALIDLFELLFGRENTCKILEAYENKYIEMFLQVVPFLNERIVPAVQRSVKERKARMKKLAGGRK